jgi:hypothetical protein
MGLLERGAGRDRVERRGERASWDEGNWRGVGKGNNMRGMVEYG